eukprot:COSAG06_NODE_39540_length_411_cov_1.137821_1_plen_98_part_10
MFAVGRGPGEHYRTIRKRNFHLGSSGWRFESSDAKRPTAAAAAPQQQWLVGAVPVAQLLADLRPTPSVGFRSCVGPSRWRLHRVRNGRDDGRCFCKLC